MAEAVRVVDVSDLGIEAEYNDGWLENITYITTPPISGPFVIGNKNPSVHNVNMLSVNIDYNIWEQVGYTLLYKSNGPDTDVFINFHHYEDYFNDETYSTQNIATIKNYTYVNLPPVAKNDVIIFENIAKSYYGNLLEDNGNGADYDSNNDYIRAVKSTIKTEHGVVTITNSSIDRHFGEFQYKPDDPNFQGEDYFEYTLEDSTGLQSTASVRLLLGENSPPDAKDDSFSMLEDTLLSGNVLADHGHGPDSDPNGDVLHVLAQTLTTAKGGTVILSESGDFTYTPKADFYGTDSFTYKLLDEYGAHDFAKVSIRVNDVADFYIGTDEGDRYVGGYLNDTLIGLRGDDVLQGGSGWDALYGNEGADTLYGGKGSDKMNGGSDADLFVLDGINYNRPDTIQDLSISEGDKIQIKDILNFDPLTDAITDFVHITQNGADSLLSVDINGTDGGASFEVAARIKGVTGLDVNQLFADGDLVISNIVAV